MNASVSGKAVLRVIGIAVLTCLAAVLPATGQPAPEAWNALYGALSSPAPSTFPSMYKLESGYLRFLGAPEDASFSVPVGGNTKSMDTPEPAAAFLNAFSALFGVNYPECALVESRRMMIRNMIYVRFAQYYLGIPVEGAEIVVQVGPDGGIQTVSASVLTDADLPEGRALETRPVLTESQAGAEAVAQEACYLGVEPVSLRVAASPDLVIFAPGLFGMSGSPVLAWKVPVSSSATEPTNTAAVYLSALDGSLLLRHNLNPGVLDRKIYDTGGNSAQVGNEDLTPARVEGQAPTGNTAVDNTYDYFGDVYNFYSSRFNQDSYDNAGSSLIAYVNVPVLNAFWDTENKYMILDNRLLADDIVAHELSHGYTLNITDFVYFGFSGALAEMYADWGGESVDLINGRGKDEEYYRWWIGEDMQVLVPDQRGRQQNEGDEQDVPSPGNTIGIRYMKDPTVFGDPDRLGSPLLASPTSAYDNGGVHINSGIGNKFVYLLTDGGQFNGENVQGLGIDKVADLMFNTLPKLTRTATYYDFFFALGKTSSELGFTLEERTQVLAAARAVEIEPPQAALLGLGNFRALPLTTTSDAPAIGLIWQNPSDISIGSLVLIRSVNGYTTDFNAGLAIPLDNKATSYLDTNVESGRTYYYTLVGDLSETFPQVLFAKATAGGRPQNLLTQVFGRDPQLGLADTMDLSYSQITFKPAIDPAPPIGANAPGVSYEDYRAIIRRNVFSLPVPRDDVNGGAFRLPLTTDGAASLKIPSPFPYFGKRYDNIVLAANGYLAFLPGVDQIPELNQPSAAAHFAIPRISFLFSDLAPDMSGEVWGRFLDDRVVFTFQEIPSARDTGGTGYETPKNTLQLELFYDGTIRVTYLYVGAINAVVGLSDGRGAPLLPSSWTNIRNNLSLTKFTQLSSAFDTLYIEPIPVIMASGGENVSFTARAVKPASVTGVPALTAEWTGTGRAPFADLGNGTGQFSWDTAEDTVGDYTVRVYAQLGGQVAWQDVRITVGYTYVLPTARNLSISANTPYENPFQDRLVPLGNPLSASYEYSHPLAKRAPDLYAEGDTIIYWFRNGQIVPELLGRLSVPAPALRAGDRWWFGVIPVAAGGFYGDLVQSPVVTVDGFPKITAVVPGYGLTIGGETVTIQGRLLSRTVKVYFGGVPATNLRILSDEALQVTVPLHEAGVVDVVCETPEGAGRLTNGYRYISDYRDLVKEDLNKDGRVDAMDVQLATNAVLKLVALSADVNGDKKIDVKDVQLVIKRALLR